MNVKLEFPIVENFIKIKYHILHLKKYEKEQHEKGFLQKSIQNKINYDIKNLHV